MSVIVCRPKSLQLDMLANAERRALAINPANEAERHTIERTPVGRRGGPRRIAVVTGRKWPVKGVQLSVSFMDSPKSDLRKRILLHMNAWGQKANVKFAETSGVGQVRIARLDFPEDQAGYWSYVGTEILEIPEDQPTMNLDGFTMKISEAEFKRVVRHEAGHTLGFDHEHMRSDIVKLIDRDKAIEFLRRGPGLDARRSGRAGSDTAEEQIDHGHQGGRSDLDHVLSVARRNHEEREAHQGRQGHQSEGPCVRGVALPKKEQERHAAAIRHRGHLGATAGIGGARVPGAAGRHDHRRGPAPQPCPPHRRAVWQTCSSS